MKYVTNIVYVALPFVKMNLWLVETERKVQCTGELIIKKCPFKME